MSNAPKSYNFKGNQLHHEPPSTAASKTIHPSVPSKQLILVLSDRVYNPNTAKSSCPSTYASVHAFPVVVHLSTAVRLTSLILLYPLLALLQNRESDGDCCITANPTPIHQSRDAHAHLSYELGPKVSARNSFSTTQKLLVIYLFDIATSQFPLSTCRP